MDGVPWTTRKMKEAVKILRTGATVSFAFGAEKLEMLYQLDEQVLAARPDMVLKAWSVASKGIITEEELAALASLKHIRKLHLNGFNNTSLEALASMQQLIKLTLGPGKKLDLSFISGYTQLEDIWLSGSFSGLENLSHCTALEKVILNTTIDSFEFMRPLDKLQMLAVDQCSAPFDFKPFNKPSLKELRLSSVFNLDQVDDLADFEHLQQLKIHAGKLEVLPDMHKLKQLRSLELTGMKVWKNPEVLQALPALEELRLTEINTKLKAEQFYFLFAMPSLQKLDYRFIDFNKKRIDTLNEESRKRGRDQIVVRQ